MQVALFEKVRPRDQKRKVLGPQNDRQSSPEGDKMRSKIIKNRGRKNEGPKSTKNRVLESIALSGRPMFGPHRPLGGGGEETIDYLTTRS